MLPGRNSYAMQLGLVTDAGLHQHLGRVNSAQAEDDLSVSSDPVDRTIVNDLNPGGSSAVESHPGYQRMRHDGEVRSVEMRGDVSTEQRQTLIVPPA